MKDFVILADSTCDLDKKLRQQYGIDYLPMNYVVDDTEYAASLDWESHSPKEFYDLMRSGKHITSTQVPRHLYLEVFSSILAQGKDVVYIACSSALSGSIGTAQVVARELLEAHPDAGIYCVDSLISSLGQGHLVIEAAKKRAEGMSAADTAAYIEAIRLKMNQAGTVASMEYLRRAGRIKAAKAFFGNLFGVKPIIISDIKGQNYAYKKVKGAQSARVALAEEMVAAADGVYDRLYISHADCAEDAALLKAEILKLAPFKEVTVGYIGPIVGASVGPGTVIAFCFGKEVTIEGNE